MKFHIINKLSLWSSYTKYKKYTSVVYPLKVFSSQGKLLKGVEFYCCTIYIKIGNQINENANNNTCFNHRPIFASLTNLAESQLFSVYDTLEWEKFPTFLRFFDKTNQHSPASFIPLTLLKVAEKLKL